MVEWLNELICPVHGLPAVFQTIAPYWHEFRAYARLWAVRIFSWRVR